MSKIIKTGGAAFPRPASEYTKNGTCPDGNDPISGQDGMALRDYFAAKALQGICSLNDDSLFERVGVDEFKAIASWTYKMADAMLEARIKGE